MICPYCVREVSFKLSRAGATVISDEPVVGQQQQDFPGSAGQAYRCSACNREIPTMFVRDYHRYPLVVGSGVGFSGHGKTVFFASMLHALRDHRLAEAWPRFFSLALDDASLTTVVGNMNRLQSGVLPEATPQTFENPTLLRLNNLPHLGSAVLCMYDNGGEVFRSGGGIQQYAHYLVHAHTVLFMISIPRLREQDDLPTAMFSLLNAFILGIQQLGGDTERQHLVIAYTMADVMLPDLAEWEVLREHIKSESYDDLADVRAYLRKIYAVSGQLHRYTQVGLRAAAFLNAALANFASVSFTIVSSLGAAPQERRLTTQIAPRRVLDPILLLIANSLTRCKSCGSTDESPPASAPSDWKSRAQDLLRGSWTKVRERFLE
ncbi:MAG TPA: hypothetical protein PKY77_03430 [Phycisphaerae bacterium]|nr:hypothetical protein [Phycisphaerae bacterium]HRY67349.1 hypothetical protein [Phycisphaerae bacterium]HSA29418.1 hypothetical protein [Phycisphaerae bacterium]